MQPKLTLPLAVVFAGLIRRAAEGLEHARYAHCPRCQQITLFRVATEMMSTGETIYICEDCGQGQTL